MTVVAYRNGVMAADTCSTMGYVKTFKAIKVIKGPSTGKLYGLSGNAPRAQEIIRWVIRGESGEMPKVNRVDGNCEALVLIADPDQNEVSMWTPEGMETYYNLDYFAIGAGAEFAFGAMHAGAGAEDAVRAAIMHCKDCGGDVVSVRA